MKKIIGKEQDDMNTEERILKSMLNMIRQEYGRLDKKDGLSANEWFAIRIRTLESAIMSLSVSGTGQPKKIPRKP
jgi:hypothetical protein